MLLVLLGSGVGVSMFSFPTSGAPWGLSVL